MAEMYTYAVARVRCREMALLTRADLSRLMQCQTEEECLRTLQDKGWGKDTATHLSAEEMLIEEDRKIWSFIGELVHDPGVFDVLRLPKDFNNLKAAVKSVITKVTPPHIYMSGGTVPPETMQRAVEQNDFSLLPDFLAEPGREAASLLLQTRDGQRCDILLDRACLMAVQKAAESSECDLLREYAELTTAIADIKIAVRAQKTGKSRAFLQEALAPCCTLSLDSLTAAALKSRDDLLSYLMLTPYAPAVEALKDSASAFEKWCDDRVIELIRGQKYEAFTLGPLVAYILARQNEISTVRVLLAGKRNHMDDGLIQERLRDLYV